jgi:hypothetical protein
MPFGIRKRLGGKNAWLNLSKSGVTGSVKLGPFTWNTLRGWFVDLPGPAYYRSPSRAQRAKRRAAPPS